ncbi:efflux RND transporter periplasmic adaptor subunit [Poseidonibacter lekithochrous]|uniref:efflux RND transporter periplasmic adaptor subunit n=1 Tax=Poseidonibacter lekithochrous TaxID=1904463 RepID=UPI000D388D41|nr:efflux RND transporter periplasmic adaptor subunit [Poseidonibacter lekithochrous]
MNLRFISLFSVILLFAGCVNEEKKETKIEEKTKVVKTFDLKNTNAYNESSKYPALIYSLQDSSMAFEVSGKITKFYFNEGDFVKKGSVVAKLDDTIYKANYNSSLANYNQAKLDFKRYKKLYESRSIAKRDFEQVKQTLDVNRSNLNIAKKRLEETKLIAEFDGVMAKKLVKDYERISEKQGIIRLQDNSAYKVKFFAPESDILSVKEKITEESAAKAVDFFVSVGKMKKKIPAKFIDISTTAEEVSRTFEVTLKIKSFENLNILPGMTANVEVVRKDKQTEPIFIPLNALFSDSSKDSFVWTINEQNRVHKQKVTTGRLEKNSIEIKEGLSKSSKIVSSGVRFLSENDEIKEYQKIGN